MDKEELFKEFSCVEKYCEGKLEELSQNSGSRPTCGDKWSHIFQYKCKEY